MESIRKWLYKPKKDDTSLLAQFFYADEALNIVAAELDSFDGRKDPERCTALVNHLRQCQDKVLTICNRIMDQLIPDERANRDFRVKFPDDVMQENLAGQLWFGAECLAAGSSIMNRETESANMRPLAKALTKSLENVRNMLREQCFRNPPEFGERLQEALKIFDRLFAEFELSYVSAMVPVKTVKEYELQQNVIVLFSETLERALKMKLLSQEMVDDYDPALMFTIPRLAIVSGLLIFPDGPLCLDRTPNDMSEMFRPFRTLLYKIRELLWTLNKSELFSLEKLLCSTEEPGDYRGPSGIDSYQVPDLDEFVTQFYNDYPNCKQFIYDFYSVSGPQQATAEPGEEEEVAAEATEAWTGNEGGEVEWVGEISESETVTDHSGPISEAGTLSCSSEDGGMAQSVSDNVRIPSATTTGFLLVNQVSHEGMLPASSGPGNGITGESLPDSDSQEDLVAQHAMCAVQASLSNLLGSDATHLNRVQSPRDSGVAGSDTCSLSDRSPDGPPAGTKDDEVIPSAEPQVQQLQTISCSCGGVVEESSTDVNKNVNDSDNQCNNTVIVTEQKTFNLESSHFENSPVTIVKQNMKDAEDSNDASSQGREEEWVGVTIGEGQCAVCSEQQNGLVNAVFDYASNWEGLAQQCSGLAGNSSRKLRSQQPSPRKPSSESPYRGAKRQSPARHSGPSRTLEVPRPQGVQEISSSYSSTCSSCRSSSTISSDSYCSSDTSSYNSECQDDEEIALAMQAAEIANRNEARAKFRSSEDLVHRLFVCIAGVADQLQTNFAGDLRNILKCVFLMNATETQEEVEEQEPLIQPITGQETSTPVDEDLSSNGIENAEEAITSDLDVHPVDMDVNTVEPPPPWVPDQMAPRCMSCQATFTVVRRRHHCRNCGKVFCARCSSNSVPLPRYGHVKPVRVCNRCFMYQVTPFTIQEVSSS